MSQSDRDHDKFWLCLGGVALSLLLLIGVVKKTGVIKINKTSVSTNYRSEMSIYP